MIYFRNFFLFLPKFAKFQKIFMKQFVTLLLFIAEFDVYLMVQPHFGQVANASERARLLVVQSDVNVFYSRIHNRAAAHGARFERNIHIAVDKTPPAEFFASTVYCRNFSVFQGIFVVFAPIVARSDDFTVMNNDAPYGNIVYRTRLFSAFERTEHKFAFVHHICSGAATLIIPRTFSSVCFTAFISAILAYILSGSSHFTRQPL